MFYQLLYSIPSVLFVDQNILFFYTVECVRACPCIGAIETFLN